LSVNHLTRGNILDFLPVQRFDLALAQKLHNLSLGICPFQWTQAVQQHVGFGQQAIGRRGASLFPLLLLLVMDLDLQLSGLLENGLHVGYHGSQ